MSRQIKTITCMHCGNPMQSTRSDKERCSECRKKYLQEYSAKKSTRELVKSRHHKLREQAFAGYGGKCECCGESRFEFLAIDHVNGGGRKEREKLSTGQIARKVVNEGFPPEYRVLCHNCNQSIGWYGYCPHQEKEKRTA